VPYAELPQAERDKDEIYLALLRLALRWIVGTTHGAAGDRKVTHTEASMRISDGRPLSGPSLASKLHVRPCPWWAVQGITIWEQAADWVASVVQRAITAERERDALRAQLAEAQKSAKPFSEGEDVHTQSK